MFKQLIIILFIPLLLAAQNGSYPDSIYMKSGKGFPCLISELNEKDITIIYQDNYKIEVPLIGVEKLILAGEGIIYQSGFGYLNNPASFTIFLDERIPKERNSKANETSSYPDSIYMKSGKGYHCLITQLNEVYATIIYRDNNKIKVPLTGVENLTLSGEGIIYQSGLGYLKHPANFEMFLYERIPKDTTNKFHLPISLGFFIEGTNVTTDQYMFRFNPLNGIGLVINFTPIDNFEIEGRISHEWFVYIPEYHGENYSINLNYFIFKNIFVMSAFTSHDNTGVEEYGVVNKTISLLGFGAGIRLSRVTSFELVYNFVLDKQNWVYDTDMNPHKINPPEKIISVAKMNFKFLWPL